VRWNAGPDPCLEGPIHALMQKIVYPYLKASSRQSLLFDTWDEPQVAPVLIALILRVHSCVVRAVRHRVQLCFSTVSISFVKRPPTLTVRTKWELFSRLTARTKKFVKCTDLDKIMETLEGNYINVQHLDKSVYTDAEWEEYIKTQPVHMSCPECHISWFCSERFWGMLPVIAMLFEDRGFQVWWGGCQGAIFSSGLVLGILRRVGHRPNYRVFVKGYSGGRLSSSLLVYFNFR
jgi:hypothetical protein